MRRPRPRRPSCALRGSTAATSAASRPSAKHPRTLALALAQPPHAHQAAPSCARAQALALALCRAALPALLTAVQAGRGAGVGARNAGAARRWCHDFDLTHPMAEETLRGARAVRVATRSKDWG